MKSRWHLVISMVTMIIVAMMMSCTTTKYVPEGECLLKNVEVKADAKDFDVSQLSQYVRMKGNSKWFSLFKIPLAIYSMSGRDTTKWVNRTLRNIGEAPVVYDSMQAVRTSADLLKAMQNMGYLDANVDYSTETKGKNLTVKYNLSPGKLYKIWNMEYDIQDDSIKALLETDTTLLRIKPNTKFSINELAQERNRITAYLLDKGYYRFHKDFITFEADSLRNLGTVELKMHLLKYRTRNNLPDTLHQRYTIGDVYFQCVDSTSSRLKLQTLLNNTAIETGKYYSASDVQRTYNNYSRLAAMKYANIRFYEDQQEGVLNCNIQYALNKPSTISFQPEGTNTAGDLGAAASLTYENRNLFHGSEAFSVQLRGAFEAITGLEGYNNENYLEYGFVSKLTYPTLAVPFIPFHVKRNINATSELSVSYNLQNRPEFHRRVFSAGWRYQWTKQNSNMAYKVDAIDLNFIHMPWISSTFKHDYLDSVSNRNAILRYNYENLFIMRSGFGFTYNNGMHAVKTNFEMGGNLLSLAAQVFDFNKNDDGQRMLFGIAYAQYVKADVDFTRMLTFDEHNSLVFHAGLGIAYPYGNSNVLPFEKRYFSGGANSVRGWSVRGLGPGKFRGHDGAIDFINQTGDMKLDLNMEYRTKLFWKFSGAFFIDAGNIWTLREYEVQPGGQFKFNEFYKQIAMAYGFGVRLNFNYFILRFDMGMKAIDPAYETTREHFPLTHPDLGRDFSFHFAVGMPF